MSDAPPTGAVWTVVVAAGSGERFGALKQFASIGDRRVVDLAVDAAHSVSTGVVVVVPPGSAESVPGADRTVEGGPTRSASVRAGLAAVPSDAGFALVHDAARPLATPDLFARVVAALRAGAEACVPVVDVTDSLRRTDGTAVDRVGLVAVQTPQGFVADVLRRAHAGGGEATDDATLAEAAGATVTVLAGEAANRKITHPNDLAVVAASART